MLDDLKFVVGSVAKKDFVPELTHLKIKHGWAQGFDGTISAATRIELDLDIMPWATEMVEAVAACKDTIALSMTKTGRLSVKSGTFKCFVPCMEMTDEILQTFPMPEGEIREVNEQFIETLKALQPFMSDDASRPWAQGIMLDKDYAFATNNVMVAQYYHGIDVPQKVTIPAQAVNGILKRKETVTHIQANDNSLTVWFGREKWIRTQLIEGEFPEQIYGIMEAPGQPPVPFENFPGFFDALETLKRFVDEAGSIHFLDGMLSTTKEEEDGAHIEVMGIQPGALFNIKYLQILKEAARAVDFTPYPGPCRFAGHNRRLRGVFTGRAQ